MGVRRSDCATLSSTAASAGLTVSWPGSKQNSRGTSMTTAPSWRWATTTGVPLNHDASHCRSTASVEAAAVRCCAAVGGGVDAADPGAAIVAGDDDDEAEGGGALAHPQSESATTNGKVAGF